MTEILVSVIILISVAGHRVFIITILYNPFYVFFTLATISLSLGSVPGEVTHTFIPDGSVPFVIVPGLG